MKNVVIGSLIGALIGAAMLSIVVGITGMVVWGWGGADYSDIVIDVSVKGPISTVVLSDGSMIKTYKVTVGFLPFSGGANATDIAVNIPSDATPEEERAMVSEAAMKAAKTLGWSNNELAIHFR